MADLFDQRETSHEPLASRMRPRSLDEYIGQDHIVGKGRLLRRAIAADQLTSVIFYGPPGSGKTTLARVIANHTKSNFITLNAVLTGVADIRKAIAEAEDKRNLYGRKTILFVDEVHRWNKSQQDALLPWVENGTIILIGATTENPFFEVNKALVSRSRVFQLKPLTNQDLMNAAKQALSDTERGYGHWKIEFEKGALEHLVETANGDARSLLNALELAVETTPEHWSPESTPPVPSYGTTIYISKEACEESIQKKVVLYDRDGDYHYDIISAFIKSLRGRDPDAACYWLARMVKAGEDPHFIFRRMLISACEDTGLADPKAISIIESCAQAFDRVGMPEGQYFLAHAALYLSTAPKSNSAMAFFDALASVEKEDAEVPNHLRDNNRDAEGFGHGSGYMYPHAYRDHWVAQQYLPDALVGRVFYTPSTQGYEKEIRDEVLSRRELQISSLMQESEEEKPQTVNPVGEWWKDNHKEAGKGKTEENLTFTPQDKKKEAVLDKAERSWRSRLDTNKAELLTQIRDTLVQMANLKRHHRSLIWNADDALLLFYILRQCPEGLSCGACRTENGKKLLEQYASTLGEMDKPLLAVERPGSAFDPLSIRSVIQELGDIQLDRIFFRDPFASIDDIQKASVALKELAAGTESQNRDIAFSEEDTLQKDTRPLLSDGALIVISQRIPRHAQHIGKLICEQIKVTGAEDLALLDKMEKAEIEFFSKPDNSLFAWDSDDVVKLFGLQGFTVQCKTVSFTEKRHISQADIEKWFNTTQSSYGKHLIQALGEEAVSKIKGMLLDASGKMLFNWKSENAFFTCRFDK
ncbi:MAG: AAA family ATPase [Treponema sp.]|nr:AAA family ATPase [Treponema sp.]